MGRRRKEEPERYTVVGEALVCLRCGGEAFYRDDWMLAPTEVGFSLDFVRRSAAAFTCASCGRIEWFDLEVSVSAEG